MEQNSYEYLSIHSRQIGRVVIAVSLLDDQIVDIVSDCLQLSSLQENALLRPMQTRPKAELLVRIAKLFLVGERLKPVTSWCDRLKKKLDERNCLVHGSPGHVEGRVHIRSWGGKNRMLGESEPWPIEKVADLADAFVAFADELDTLKPLFGAWIEAGRAMPDAAKPSKQTPRAK